MSKGAAKKRYPPEFKQPMVETMKEESLSLNETMRRFHINYLGIIQRLEQIYPEEGSEDLAVERRGRKSTEPPAKLPKAVGEN